MEGFTDAYKILQDKLESWLRNLVESLPNMIVAGLVLVVFWMAAKFAYRLINRLVRRAGGNINVADLLGNITRVLVFGLGLFIALNILNLSQAVTTVLTGAGIVGLALGFALQDPLANLFSGVMLSVKELYGTGDLVQTNDFFGKIERITLRSTIIRSLDGQEIVIPNKDVLQKPLRNYSVTGERRVEFEFGVSYAEDLDRVAKVAAEAVAKTVTLPEGREVEVFWTGFGDSSINATLRFWQLQIGQKAFLDVRSKAIVAVKRAFDEGDILIPFPIRTLDFQIKGGANLAEMLSNGQASAVPRKASSEASVKQTTG